MNTYEPSPIEKFRVIYETTFSKSLPDEHADAMLKAIKRECGKVSPAEIQSAMRSIAGQYDQYSKPKLTDILTAIKRIQGREGGGDQNLYDTSRRYFLDRLRNEPDLDKRASIIFHCGDDMVPYGPPAEPPFDNGPSMIKNTCRLYVPSGNDVDAIHEALKLCKLNGIEVGPMVSTSSGKMNYLKATVSQAIKYDEVDEREEEYAF